MAIHFDSSNRVFTLSTDNSMYQMQIGPVGHLLHLYYGVKCDGAFDYLQIQRDCGFSANPYDLQEGRGWSLDLQGLELSTTGNADFRTPALDLTTESGIRGADLRYHSHTISGGKYTVTGMPAAFDKDGTSETLSIILEDGATGIQAELLYGVFPETDMITRALRIHNRGNCALRLNKAASICLDLTYGSWDMIHFHGRHCYERKPERLTLGHGTHTLSSLRGTSSHQYNPFVILCDRDATETAGSGIGAMLVYSGSHKEEIEVDQSCATRLVMGIQDTGFSWDLAAGETFHAPEVLLTYSREGLGRISRNYHRFIQHNLCRSRYALERRPVLLNSWEAAYMDFTDEKLLRIATDAKELGVELFVIDDGWFGNRNDDLRSLGDWYVNEDKLVGGLDKLAEKIHGLGMQVGLWFEPEMISEDSDLYRAHPDWALTVPGRKPTMGRCQLVLDMTRKDVVDYLYETIAKVLRDCHIDYVKWDMNRHLTDYYSNLLPADRQGEIAHRFCLGLYDLLDRLTSEFPNILFEGCSGGGGRFDAGMLAYHPQIWCSDNTDPINRLTIQEGTSYGYPIPSMGSHVSASPNHQTGRSTPIGTRATVAMSGTFGYELDPGQLREEEKEVIRHQISRYKLWQDLIREGDYYRLSPATHSFTAWQQVSADRKEALVSIVLSTVVGNPGPVHLKLQGLDPAGKYQLKIADFHGCKMTLQHDPQRIFTGAQLMYGGYSLPQFFGDYPSCQLYWKQLDD